MNLRHLIQKGLVRAILHGSAGALLALGYSGSGCAPQEEKPAPIYYHSSSGDLVLPNGTVCQRCTFMTEGEESQCEIEAIGPSTPPVKFQLLQEKSKAGEQKKGELTKVDWALYPLLPPEPKEVPLPLQAEVEIRCASWWGGFPANTSKLRPTISRLEDIVVTPEPEVAMAEPPAAPPSPPPAIKPKPKKESLAVTVPLPPPQTNNPPDCGIAYPLDKEGIIDLSNGQSGTDIGSRSIDKFLSHYTVIIDEKDKVTLRFPPLRCLDRERDALELSFKVKKIYGKKFVFGYGPTEQGKQEIFNWGRESFFLDAGAQGNVSQPGETYDVFLFLGEYFKRPLADGSLGRNTEPVRLSFAVKPVNDRPYVRNPLPAENLERLYLPNASSRHLRLSAPDYFGDHDNDKRALNIRASYVCRRQDREEEISGTYSGKGSVLVPGRSLHCGAEPWGGQTFLRIFGNDGEFDTKEAVYREVSLYSPVRKRGKNVSVEVLVEGDSHEGKKYCGRDCTGFIGVEPKDELVQFLDKNIASLPSPTTIYLQYSADLTQYSPSRPSNSYLKLEGISLVQRAIRKKPEVQDWKPESPFYKIIAKVGELLPFSKPEQSLKSNVGIEVKIQVGGEEQEGK